MVSEVVELLASKRRGLVVDCTMGPGGHAEALLCALPAEMSLLGIDRDPAALEVAGKRLQRFGSRVILHQGNFKQIGEILRERNLGRPDAILMDLGISSVQLEDPARGFGFACDGPIDMRMDQESSISAFELLRDLPERELRSLFLRYGEERFAGRIARAIVRRRISEPILTTGELARLIMKAVPSGRKPWRIHPATRVFQALRIVVNEELASLQGSLTASIRSLEKAGRIVVITYHSLEDRIVKREFRRFSGTCVCSSGLPFCRCGKERFLEVITRKPMVASREETARNPRARSAKMRVAERIG